MSRMLILLTFCSFLVLKNSFGATYNEVCGTIQGITCDEGYSCVYNSASCDPDCGNSDCSGICLREDPNPSNGFCGGFAGFTCPSGSTCYDTKGDSCSANCGGADCGGTCYFDRDVAVGDSCTGCAASKAPCVLCDDGETQYGACTSNCVLSDDFSCVAEVTSDEVCPVEGDSCDSCIAPLCACQLCDDGVTEVGCCGDCRINSELECVYVETSSSECPVTVSPGDSCDTCIQPLCMCGLCDDGVTQFGCCGSCVINDELECVYVETGTTCPVTCDDDCSSYTDQTSCENCEENGCVWDSDELSCSALVFCTQEVRLCPDGETYVGRTGPNCEFEDCPDTPSDDCDTELDTCLSECPDTTESASTDDDEDDDDDESQSGSRSSSGKGPRRLRGSNSDSSNSCRGLCNREYRDCLNENNESSTDGTSEGTSERTSGGSTGSGSTDEESSESSEGSGSSEDSEETTDEDCDNACTEDALICDDGTSVSRDPCNNCEFEECPDEDDNDDNSNAAARNEASSGVYAGNSKVLSWFVVPLAILIGVILLIGGSYLLYRRYKPKGIQSFDDAVQESTHSKHNRVPSGSINGELMNTSGNTTTTMGETTVGTV